MRSLNMDFESSTISDLESCLIILDRVIDSRIEDNPKSGMVLNKGCENEVKMKYQKVKKLLNEIHNQYALSGTFSIGCCQTCSRFNTKGHSSEFYGTCGGNTVHAFNTCQNHSKSGGGFGLVSQKSRKDKG